ncbi:hypothetical protein JDN40_15760 [Rhodomicrobium vannielii ATCC 17100]|uniref:hypothetical protein n=1 Tax=Rhodomicrobium vannielii TaxID=1069 RepID=UPI00191A1E7A|nr:hypothetical protein [Rhodomicrobium vannielii]MBJ7535563.1 hypothetical protein [Rhodomicrobium vannielii ATCC 17100]
MNYEVVLAEGRAMYIKVEKLASESQAFVIRADRRFRHTKKWVRSLRFNFEGRKSSPFWWWTAPLDGFYAGWLLGCRVLAIQNHNYTWYYKYTPEGVDLFFDPPTAEAPKGSNWPKNLP